MTDTEHIALMNKCYAIEAALLDKNYPAAADLTFDLTRALEEMGYEGGYTLSWREMSNAA